MQSLWSRRCWSSGPAAVSAAADQCGEGDDARPLRLSKSSIATCRARWCGGLEEDQYDGLDRSHRDRARRHRQAPFLMMFRRPDATHFEILAEGKRSVRIFDGKQGWKQRLNAERTPETQGLQRRGAQLRARCGRPRWPAVRFQGQGCGPSPWGRGRGGGSSSYRLELTLRREETHRLDRCQDFPRAAIRPRNAQQPGRAGTVVCTTAIIVPSKAWRCHS